MFSKVWNGTQVSPFLFTFLLGMLCIVKYSSVASFPVRHFLPLAGECSSIPSRLSATAFEFIALPGIISSLSELTLVMLVLVDVLVVRLLPVPLLSVLEFLASEDVPSNDDNSCFLLLVYFVLLTSS